MRRIKRRWPGQRARGRQVRGGVGRGGYHEAGGGGTCERASAWPQSSCQSSSDGGLDADRGGGEVGTPAAAGMKESLDSVRLPAKRYELCGKHLEGERGTCWLGSSPRKAAAGAREIIGTIAGGALCSVSLGRKASFSGRLAILRGGGRTARCKSERAPP